MVENLVRSEETERTLFTFLKEENSFIKIVAVKIQMVSSCNMFINRYHLSLLDKTWTILLIISTMKI